MLADQQRQEALAAKQRASHDAKTHLDQIEKAWHNEFEAKKNDRSNHEQSMTYKRDDRERSSAGIEHYWRQQQSMQDELNSQSWANEESRNHSRVESLWGDVATTGFEFECYSRDPQMHEERWRTSEYQIGQWDAEIYRA